MRCVMLLFVLLLLLSPWEGARAGRCPAQCSCALRQGRKVVVCSEGGLLRIPTSDMDPNIHSLEVVPPPQGPRNNLTLGRIFLKFTSLECVRIEDSAIPAIGDSSFWPGRRMRRLLLPRNRIAFLRESDFSGLRGLLELDLSSNEISASPSAPFRHLLALRRLRLADNRLHALVPRFFYLLQHLEELDLSGNPLGQIGPEDLQDVRRLRVLRVARCRLKQLHPTVYQQLPFLEELDLRDNLVASIGPGEFRHLGRLRRLRLDGNLLATVTEGAFHGHAFDELGLARNELSSLSEKAFLNASVRLLDLSHNRLEYVADDTSRPLSASLEVLDVSYNDLGAQAFASLLRPLRELRDLRASDLLLKNLLEDTFDLLTHLRTINLSRNALSGLEESLLSPLSGSLEDLDLSYNLFARLTPGSLEGFMNLTSLRALHLRGNPFDCSGCLVPPLFRALDETFVVGGNCSEQGCDCPVCQLPPDMSGRCVRSLQAEELYCHVGSYERHHLVYTSKVGLIVAVAIIVVIVCIIVVIIIVYRRHIAHYYTHEEEQRAWKGMYENPAALAGGGLQHYSDDSKPTFIATPDKVDENIDDLRRPPPASIMR